LISRRAQPPTVILLEILLIDHADFQNWYGEMLKRPSSSPSTHLNRSTRPSLTNSIFVSPALRSSNMKNDPRGRSWSNTLGSTPVSRHLKKHSSSLPSVNPVMSP